MSADDYQNRLCAEIERLTKQVADLRAALEALVEDECDCREDECAYARGRRVLAATQPQEVQP